MSARNPEHAAIDDVLQDLYSDGPDDEELSPETRRKLEAIYQDVVAEGNDSLLRGFDPGLLARLAAEVPAGATCGDVVTGGKEAVAGGDVAPPRSSADAARLAAEPQARAGGGEVVTLAAERRPRTGWVFTLAAAAAAVVALIFIPEANQPTSFEVEAAGGSFDHRGDAPPETQTYVPGSQVSFEVKASAELPNERPVLFRVYRIDADDRLRSLTLRYSDESLGTEQTFTAKGLGREVFAGVEGEVQLAFVLATEAADLELLPKLDGHRWSDAKRLTATRWTTSRVHYRPVK